MPATRRTAIFLAGCLLACVPVSRAGGGRAGDWESIAPGLELGTFAGPATPLGDGTITILRIDPQRWELRLLAASETGAPSHLTPRRWCEEHGLVAAINAGMFDRDYSTHMGFMSNGSHTNNPRVNHYRSVAAFGPRHEGLPPFRIHDLDAPGASMDDVRAHYRCVVQNLRLIKRPAINRWSQQERRWSETALGEDRAGRVLFIFCRTPYTMHDLNETLVALPIDLVCAQHLEGGGLAQLSIRLGDFRRDYVGAYETGGNDKAGDGRTAPLPNVIGVAPRGGRPPLSSGR